MSTASIRGKTREYDPWSGEASEAANPMGGYRSRSTGSLKERVYYAMENGKGERKLVAMTEQGPVVLEKGKPSSSLPSQLHGGATAPGDKFKLNGEEWTIRQAKTSEIEAGTDTRYYKNAMASTVKNIANLRSVARALNEIDRLKSTPEWAAYTSAKPRTVEDRRLPAVPRRLF